MTRTTRVPNWLQLNTATRVISSGRDIVPQSALGVWVITVTATDEDDSSLMTSAEFRLTVTLGDRSPVAVDDHFAITEPVNTDRYLIARLTSDARPRADLFGNDLYLDDPAPSSTLAK